MRRFLVVLAVGFGALLAVSRFVPTVERITVHGAEHHATEDVLRIADIAPGDPWFWITRWRVRGLEADPWIRQARVIRHWPDAVAVSVWERTPVLTDGARAWADDGVELPGARAEETAGLPRLEGWGPARLDEALELVALFADDELEVISYTPKGFDIDLADGAIFTPDVESLRRQWAAIQHRNGSRLAVYPWGVSKTQ